MKLIKMNEDNVDDIAKLEAKIYPMELCLGGVDYIADMYKYGRDNSFWYGIYKKRLIAYLIMYYDTFKKYIYVSDLVSTNSAATVMLLINLFNNFKGKLIESECRPDCYKMIKKINEKYNILEIKIEKLMPNYYCNKKDAYYLLCKIKHKETKGIRKLKNNIEIRNSRVV
ncbi:MAG: hypothetical protein ACOCP8_00130 [archaeon]